MERKCFWGGFCLFSYIAEGFGTIGPAGRSCWRRRSSSERRSHHDQTSFTAGSVTAVDGRPVLLLLLVAGSRCCCWWKMIRTTCWSSLGDDTVGRRFFTGGCCCCRQRVGWTHISRCFLLKKRKRRLNERFNFRPKQFGWHTKCEEEDNVSRDKGSATGGVSIEWASTWTDWLMTFLEPPQMTDGW